MKGKLPPMPPNRGPLAYPIWEPITKVLDAIERYKEGERPCPKCKGTGDMPTVGKYGGTWVTCDQCDGSGQDKQEGKK